MGLFLYDLLMYLGMALWAFAITVIFRNITYQPGYITWLVVLLVLSLLCDSVGRLLIILSRNPNPAGWSYHLLAPLILSVFFYKLILWPKLKVTMACLVVIHIAFAIVNLLFIQTRYMNSFTNAFSSFVILVYCVIFYYKLLKELPTQQLQSMPAFWIVSGLFFSYAGKLVIYIVTHFLIHYLQDNLIIIWTFHNFLTLIGNAVVTYGIWINHKQLKITFSR